MMRRSLWILFVFLGLLLKGPLGSAAEPQPIRVSQAGTHFETTDGKPFFWLGDTVWNGPLLAKEKDWETFLADRAAKKFSVIQFNMLAPWRTAATDELGQTAYTGQDPITINEAFFKRLDQRIAAITKHGMVAAPVLLWTLGKKEESPGQLPEKEAIKLARFMVDRYRDVPLCWILPGDGKYEGETAERWKRIGREVFGTEGKHPPVTLHAQGMAWPFETFRKETWVGFFGYQSGHGDDARTLSWIHSGPAREAGKKEPVRPILNLEPPYEDHVAYQSKRPHSAFNVRRACYWSLLVTPTCGVTYGCHGIWSWQEVAGVPREHAGSGLAKPWREAKDLPGSTQMKHLATCFQSVNWWELKPAQELLERQPGKTDPAKFIAVASTPGNKQLVAYTPVGEAILLNVKDLPADRNAHWFNPRTAESQPVQQDEAGIYQPPTAEDWVLIVK